jgi:hypothetical protein
LQHQRPLIESEYYAAPLSGRESSTSTGCGKISAGGAISCKRICLADAQWLGCQGQARSINIHLLNQNNITQTRSVIVSLAP